MISKKLDFTGKICLIGMMGVGKTTVGKLLAKSLKYNFVDMDLLIENSQNMSISEIFKTKKEDYFRKIEFEMLISLLTNDRYNNHLISLGGGTPCYNGAIDIINKHSLSIFLSAGPETIIKRLNHKNAIKSRPLLAGLTEAEQIAKINSVLIERHAIYSQADIVVNADGAMSKIHQVIIGNITNNE